MPIQKILIANRGEIALRVIRACKELGIETVAIYSEADRDSLHARYADEAHLIGPSPARESYLRGEWLIELAQVTGCDAIHPGYGFLAENADFAEAVERSDLIFIGPAPGSIRTMGDKLAARRLANAQEVPVIPGSEEPVRDAKQVKRLAQKFGYPILIKATAGGGGKGMRLVADADEVNEAFDRAASEAEAAFGDRRLYVERFLPGAKHIEFQILADGRGTRVHLGERDCSIQRRHQKLIEESPSVALSVERRAEMGEAAVKIATAADYRNAGTVEFLYHQGRYYFLEMNTRLQVEHPVTEMITGIDLVHAQIRIARGEKLDYRQDRIKLSGAAIECRIYAEDPANHFYPSTGTIEGLALPDGPGVRVDSDLYLGSRVTHYYDPLLLKLIAWAQTREAAIERMSRVLDELIIFGVRTTIDFSRQAMADPRFLRGDYTADFVVGFEPTEPPETTLQAIAVAMAIKRDRERFNFIEGVRRSDDGWKRSRFR
ncbi:MAG: acetyl/propionyl/methylcrotonyl-CoA carboxylase subunit alpha [Candidatus Bipolaricaulia bacterium]